MTCQVRGCQRPVKSRGWCSAHYEQRRKKGTISVGARSLIEDVEWLIATGETHAENVARRVGSGSPMALARRLERNGRSDLVRQIRGADPGRPR